MIKIKLERQMKNIIIKKTSQPKIETYRKLYHSWERGINENINELIRQ